jgi:Zn-dependent protease
MAVAGPAANVLIALLCVLTIHAGIAVSVFHPPDSAGFESIVASNVPGPWHGIAFVVSVFFSLNLMLACLNMIPLPPLDGSAAVLLLLNEGAARRYQEFLMMSHGLGMMGLFVAWQVFDVVFDPVFWAVIHLIYPGVTYG